MSGPRITDAAVEAGGDALYDYLFEFGLNGTDASNAAEKVLTAALPHIRRAVIEELVAKAECEVEDAALAKAHGMAYGRPRWAHIAELWLRAELEGGDQ